MKEIVTIQVGDFANFVGSHFWNFQVSTSFVELQVHCFETVHCLIIHFFSLLVRMSCLGWLLTPMLIRSSRIRILTWMCFIVPVRHSRCNLLAFKHFYSYECKANDIRISRFSTYAYTIVTSIFAGNPYIYSSPSFIKFERYLIYVFFF